MERATPLDRYFEILSAASNMVWKVFKLAYTTQQDPTRAFSQITARYRQTPAEKYVIEYIALCVSELSEKKSPDTYIAEAQKASAEMWKVFKGYAEKVEDGTMKDADWSDYSTKAAEVGFKRYDSVLWEYAKGYTILCVHELDRRYRALHGISEEMTLSEYMTGGT